MVSSILSDYYRVPDEGLARVCAPPLSGEDGFFLFGPDVICYGKSATGVSPEIENAGRFDASRNANLKNSEVHLPFNPVQVVENLLRERYVKQRPAKNGRMVDLPIVRSTYYAVRELLPVSIRKHLQKFYLGDWSRLLFPRWPVDFTVDTLHERILRLSMQANGIQRMPFIWFWPNGAPNALIVTHDVETAAGRDFTRELIDLDEAHGIRASFQVIPEKRYEVPDEYVALIRSRGFEFNIHDLNHDGQLYQERQLFLQRSKKINSYVKKFATNGFRAGVMYRNLDWYDAYEMSYDMSMPNVAHLEPQRGGCCTVFPYFVGKILEIPLTTCQDYSLFQILNDYSIDLWKQQLALLRKRNGLMSFIAHPDYLIDAGARKVYESLLQYLQQMVQREKIWMALPGEVDQWWRARSQMHLVQADGRWTVEGPQSDQAKVAFAVLDGDNLRYEVTP
ncbi:MAG: hypothetical protein ABSD87_12235 [Candidatus Acidiferrales bacterium]|jgi:hypothetical protein